MKKENEKKIFNPDKLIYFNFIKYKINNNI
jgi:hypothetical protein